MVYVYGLIGLAIGMSVFMYGMTIMGEGLEAVAGKRMSALLGRVTKNRFCAVGVGAGVTAVLHSSTATTVMVVGFVGSGLMSLCSACAVIMGANIGTTVTGILIALGSLDLSLYLMLPCVVGTAILVFSKQRYRRAGAILLGFGLVFIGLDLMSSAIVGVSDTDLFKRIFVVVDSPILLMLLGASVTAIVQSSTAVNGLLIALAVPLGGVGIDIVDALFIILGTNVGTCMTSLIASAGASALARRASLFHLVFNVVGTVVFGVAMMCVSAEQLATLLARWFGDNVKFQIAWFNLVQNVLCAVLCLPFLGGLVRFTEWAVKDRKGVDKVRCVGV